MASDEAEAEPGWSNRLKSKDESLEFVLGLCEGDALGPGPPALWGKRCWGRRARIWRTRASALSSLSSTSVRCLRAQLAMDAWC